MARKPDVRFSQAVDSWLRWCESRDYSQNTIMGYRTVAKLFQNHLGEDLLARKITELHIEQFMAAMSTEVVQPAGIAPRPPRQRAPKTLRNYHTALSSFWSWATAKGWADAHVVREVDPPRVRSQPIEPLSAAAVVKLFAACEHSRPWRNSPLTQTIRPTWLRDRMIISLFLETLIRCSEAADLRIGDIQFGANGGKIFVNRGKGEKSRWAPFGRRCREAINDYLTTRTDWSEDDFLVVNELRDRGKSMDRNVLSRLVKRIGKRAGVTKVTPHILRTTGACYMVHNGISAFELQRIMGHTDIQTTMRYVRAAKIDLEKAIASASPIDNLKLR
jgi:integrase/recombinase XerD